MQLPDILFALRMCPYKQSVPSSAMSDKRAGTTSVFYYLLRLCAGRQPQRRAHGEVPAAASGAVG